MDCVVNSKSPHQNSLSRKGVQSNTSPSTNNVQQSNSSLMFKSFLDMLKQDDNPQMEMSKIQGLLNAQRQYKSRLDYIKDDLYKNKNVNKELPQIDIQSNQYSLVTPQKASYATPTSKSRNIDASLYKLDESAFKENQFFSTAQKTKTVFLRNHISRNNKRLDSINQSNRINTFDQQIPQTNISPKKQHAQQQQQLSHVEAKKQQEEQQKKFEETLQANKQQFQNIIDLQNVIFQKTQEITQSHRPIMMLQKPPTPRKNISVNIPQKEMNKSTASRLTSRNDIQILSTESSFDILKKDTEIYLKSNETEIREKEETPTPEFSQLNKYKQRAKPKKRFTERHLRLKDIKQSLLIPVRQTDRLKQEVTSHFSDL